MKKVLITGITGFAGSFLAELLVARGDFLVAGTHVSDKHLHNLASVREQVTLFPVNLLDEAETFRVIGEYQPDIIYHLAASSRPGESFAKPAEFLHNNIASEVHVLEAVRKHGLMNTKILIISSAHVYGWVLPEDLPMDEATPFRPDNPYSVSKIAQDYLGMSYFLAYQEQIIRLRPGNHIGPRLSPDISISRWAKTIAEMEKGIKEPVLRVGNLTTKRDFSDVRDIVRAYFLAGERGHIGDVYNISSGVAFSMREMLEKLLALATIPITVASDPALFRPSDIPELRINAQKFMDTTGWKPEIPIEKTLQDTLNYWRANIS